MEPRRGAADTGRPAAGVSACPGVRLWSGRGGRGPGAWGPGFRGPATGDGAQGSRAGGGPAGGAGRLGAVVLAPGPARVCRTRQDHT